MSEQQGETSNHWTPLVVAIVLLAIIGAMVYTALEFTEEARRIPLVVGTPVVFFLGVQILREVIGLRRPRPEAATTTGAPPRSDTVPGAGDEPPPPDPAISVPAMFLWILFLAVVVWLLGMIAGVVVFIVIFARAYGRESWRNVAYMVLGTLAVVQGFFVYVLGIQLYDGVVPGLLGL